MSVLAFGQNGQVATELAALGVQTLDRNAADLSDPDACAAVIAASNASAVINAAAFTAVDRAEEEEALALTINGTTPGAMARACAAKGIPFIHISTDYVFDGKGDAPYGVDHPTAPIGAYGRTKLAGEEAVRDAGGVHGIIRTSWVFSSHGTNFLKTMLRLGAEKDHLTIVADQIGGPTPARAIAAACVAMVPGLIEDPARSGTYHFSGAPDASWADFARAIFAKADIACDVTDIPTSEFPTPAKRPLNSRLDCMGIETAFGIARPDWQEAVRVTVRELQKL